MKDNIEGSLSIVMPIYNVEQYLGLCINSLCKALLSIESKEVICVNDGSTDDSLDVIKSYYEQYDFIKIIDQKNAGYGGAVNAGLNVAKGEYVSIVESDDAILPDVYTSILKSLNENPDADFVKTPYFTWVDEKLSKPIRMDNPKWGVPPENPVSILEYSYPMAFPPSIWSSVYRRKYLNDNGIRVIETPGASYQDTYFSVLVHLLGGKMLYHNEGYYLYRSDREESSVHSRTKTTEIFDIHDELRLVLEEKGVFSGKIEALFYAAAFRRVLWFFARVIPHFQENAFKLAYLQFSPVFNDPVLYSGVELELLDHERNTLAELKGGKFSSFHSYFAITRVSGDLQGIQGRESKLSSGQKIGVNIFGFVFRPFIETAKFNKLKAQPVAFFRDSKSAFTRKVGSLLTIHKLPQPSPNLPLTSIQKVGVLIFRVLLKPFIEKRKMDKLKAQPRAFFRDTKSLFTRSVGIMLGLIK